MKIISYTEREKGVIHFIYEKTDFIRWNKLGKRSGDVGGVLISRNYNTQVSTYLCYGTIEEPNRDRYLMNIIHACLPEGPFLKLSELVTYKPILPITQSYKMEFLIIK